MYGGSAHSLPATERSCYKCPVRKGEATRQGVLDEATRLASQVGLTGLTIGALAERTQLSKSGLFAHFRSKEALQLQVLENAAAGFRQAVVVPALGTPRGEPRLRELIDRWFVWTRALPGGCPFVAASFELDDQPGPVRDYLVQNERDWFDTLVRVVQSGVAEGHFREDTDAEQFAQDLDGILLAFHRRSRLLLDPRAEDRARRGFEALIAAAREPAS